MTTPKKGLIFSVLTIGFTSTVGQLLLLRELITIFYGNELTIGVMLASWLFWVSIGSLAGTKLSCNLGLILLLNAFILPCALFSTSFITKIIPGYTPGEIIGIFPVVGISFLLLAPACFIVGISWSLACKEAIRHTDSPLQIGRIYIYEAVGAAAGGFLFSFVLAKWVGPYTSCFILSGLNISAAMLLFTPTPLKRAAAVKVWGSLLLVSLSLTLFNYPQIIERLSRELRWKPLEVITSKNSIYGNISVIKFKEKFSLFENGLHLFTTEDILTQEETAHYPLLQHQNPETVLLIGGGLGGTIRELLKHPVERIDYCELDPLIIKLSKAHLPKEELLPLNDPRVNLHYIDGRLFIKKSLKNAYDVIIINLPEPFTAQLNRFYSLEFYKEAKEILSPDGIISFGITSSENYISPEQAQLLASIFKTLKQVFPMVLVFPGDTNYFFGSKDIAQLTDNPSVLTYRLKDRGISTKYIEPYLKFKLSPERLAYIGAAIKESESMAKLNRDFAPIGYFYDMVLWSSHFTTRAQHIFEILYRMNILWFILPIFVCAVLFSFIVKMKRAKNLAVELSILTTGASELVFQLVVILAFQVLYGYVYYKLGLIFASFMAGLILGSIWINKKMADLKNDYSCYLISQCAIVVYPLLLPSIFYILRCVGNRVTLREFTETIFAFLPAIAGFIGGWQFPLANKLCRTADASKMAGRLYGLDLFGSCVGALFASSILLPVLGIPQTCLILSMVNVSILWLLILSRKNYYSSSPNI